MAKMLAELNISWGDRLLMDSKDAQLLAEIVDRCTVIEHKYVSALGDNVLVIKSGKQDLSVRLCDTSKLLTEQQLEQRIAQATQPEEDDTVQK